MAGRRPKPTALKKLQGNPGNRKLNDQEPHVELGTPERPQGMSRAGKREWHFMTKALETMGLLSMIDGKALAVYCEAYSTWEAAEKIKRHAAADYPQFAGLLMREAVYNKLGDVIDHRLVEHPAINISIKAAKVMKAFLIEFGLTPASRSKIKVEKAHQEDPLDTAMKTTARDGVGTVGLNEEVSLDDVDESVIQ